jgi:putative ABC transport system permease protein
VTPEFFSAREWDVADGRLFAQEEVDEAAKVALIGQTVAGNLFGDSDPLNQVIRIRNVPFCVIGVLERKGQSTYGQDQDDTVLIPLSTAKKKVIGSSQANARAVGSIAVKVREARAMQEAEQGSAASCASGTACSRSRTTTSGSATSPRRHRPGC